MIPLRREIRKPHKGDADESLLRTVSLLNLFKQLSQQILPLKRLEDSPPPQCSLDQLETLDVADRP